MRPAVGAERTRTRITDQRSGRNAPMPSRPVCGSNDTAVMHHWLFKQVTPAAAAGVAALFVRRRYRRRSVLFDQGDEVNGLFVVRAGVLRVGRVSSHGSEFTIAIVGAGDLAGDEAVFTADRFRTTRATCMKDALVDFVSRADLNCAMARTPKIAYNLARYLQHRHNDAVACLEDVSTRKVADRIVHVLERFVPTHGVLVGGRGMALTLRLTHAQIASLIGSTRETVTHEIGNLIRVGRLAKSAGRFVLPYE